VTGWDTRAEIGLRPPRAISTNINPTAGVAFHYGGGGPYKRTNHADCRAIWRAYQAWHMAASNTNNYTDIAYNMGVCHHDVILEGRSTRTRPKVRGGANGDAVVNGNRYSICSIWGSNDGAPTDGLKAAYLAARAFLRDKGGAGTGTVGHRDMAQTSCPGGGIYAWIQAGCPAPNQPPPPPPPGDDDMADLTDADKAWIDAKISNDLTKYHREQMIPTLNRVRDEIIAAVTEPAPPTA
jgi:hypothetical protein